MEYTLGPPQTRPKADGEGATDRLKSQVSVAFPPPTQFRGWLKESLDKAISVEYGGV